MSFTIGQTVYLKTDPDQMRRMVTGIILRPGTRLYMVTLGTNPESHHYDIEMSTEPDVRMRLGLDEPDRTIRS